MVDITHSFRVPAGKALVHVSLSVRRGEIVALLGPNGAGKTTLVKIVNRLVLPNSGRFFVDGTDGMTHGRQVAERIGTLFDNQRCLYYGLTVKQNVIYFGKLKGATTRCRASAPSSACLSSLREKATLLPSCKLGVAKTNQPRRSSEMAQYQITLDDATVYGLLNRERP